VYIIDEGNLKQFPYNMESTVASKILFKDLCHLCEKISDSARNKKGEYLKKYINYFREYSKKIKLESPLLVSTILVWFCTRYVLYKGF
jgi:hypothetical protein